MIKQNPIRKTLIELGACSEAGITPYYPRVRDREDVSVLCDEHSGVIFLGSVDHVDLTHYEEIKGGEYWQASTRAEALQKYGEDDKRRYNQFVEEITGKDYVDVGCGTGGILDLLKNDALSITGVEPQREVREELEHLGYAMYRTSADLPRESFDVASLFHVLEHLTNPIETLRDVRNSLRSGGKIVVEVPHARDVLLQLDSFKAFSLWSEHLVLHTRESLRIFLEEAGFSRVEIEGFQRYPLSNHIGWLVNGKPCGQQLFPQLCNEQMRQEYVKLLAETDQTDTLIAIAYA